MAAIFPRLHTIWGEIEDAKFIDCLDFKWSQLRRLKMHTPLSEMTKLGKNCPNLKFLSLKLSHVKLPTMKNPRECSLVSLTALHLEDVRQLDGEVFAVAPTLKEVHIEYDRGVSFSRYLDSVSLRATQPAEIVAALPSNIRF